jgi:hypothetical protein
MPTSPSPPACPTRHSPTTPRNPTSVPTLSYLSMCTSSPLPSFIFPNRQHTRCLQNCRPVLTSPSPTRVRSSPLKPPHRSPSSPFVTAATSRAPLHPEAEVSANSPSHSLRHPRACAARPRGKRLPSLSFVYPSLCPYPSQSTMARWPGGARLVQPVRQLYRPEFGGIIFSSFLSPNSGVTLSFSLFFSLSLDLFQKL